MKSKWRRFLDDALRPNASPILIRLLLLFMLKITYGKSLHVPIAMSRVGILSSAFCALFVGSCDRKENRIHSPPAASGKEHQAGDVKVTNSQQEARRSKKEARIEKSEAGQALGKFASDWENLAGQSKGQETLAKQKELALALIPKLGGSDELLKLLDFLTERGSGDLRKEILEKHLGVIFTGPGAGDAREWLLTVEDEKLREQLSRIAGETFSGVGFKDYFDQMRQYGSHNSQAALLTGYCVSLAKSDPEGAVRVYKELGYPQKIDNTGMADVMASFPPGTNFLKFATEIREDSMTLARRSRSALLQNWAGVKPEEAAQYVLANSATSVNPDQMGVVVGTWAKQSPDAALGWLNKAPVGKARDEGMAALARQSTASTPSRAMDYAGQISDFDKRVATATQVFKEWEKTDRPAATAAWLKLFPDPGQ